MTVQHELFLARLAELQGDMSDAAFARHAGVKATTFSRYKQGSFPGAEVAASIAERYGATLDWLLGRPDALRNGQRLDPQHLSAAIEIVEEWLEANNRLMTPAKKAEVVTQLYELIADDAAQGRRPVDVKRLHGILRLVA